MAPAKRRASAFATRCVPPFAVAVVAAIPVVLAFAAAAHADEAGSARYRLEVLARPGADRCPTAERLVPAVVARVGHDPFDEAAPARLQITFERGPKGYEARIERFAADGAPAGKKSLAGPSCEALADALALSISIAVDAPLPPPRHVGSASASTAPSAPGPIAPAALPEGWGDAPIAEPPREAPTEPGARPFAQVAVGAAIAGAAPSVAPLAALGVGVTTTRYALSVEGVGTLPMAATDGSPAVSVGLLGARPVACRALAGGARLSVCAQGFVGALQGSAEGAGGRRDSTFFASVGGGAQGVFPIGAGLSVVPSIGASFTLTRTSLYANDRAVFTTRPIGLDLGIAVRLPL